MSLTPMKAIRAKCKDCMCGSASEVRLCPCEDCALWPYRLGHRPRSAEPEKSKPLKGKTDTDTAPAI